MTFLAYRAVSAQSHVELMRNYSTMIFFIIRKPLSGANSARVIALMSVPGAPRLLRSEWLHPYRWIFKYIPQMAPMEIFVDAVKRIRAISTQILTERTKDALAVSAGDSSLAGKKDIMSLLVQSRMQERKIGGHGGANPKMIMSDEMMTEQVVRPMCTINYFFSWAHFNVYHSVDFPRRRS